VSVLFADTSALVRAYLSDEPRHDEVRALLLDGDQPVVASELAQVEFAAAAHAAERAGRIHDRHELLARFDASCATDGLLAILAFDAACVALAFELVRDHPLRTLDALHLAVLQHQVVPLFGDAVLVSCDAGQLAAARALGLNVFD
jgi:uncharacterized protein